MQKIIVTIAITLIFITSTAHADTTGSLDLFFQPDTESTHPTGSLFVAHHFEKWGLGASAFFLVTEGWAEFLLGPTWSPTKSMELGIQIGGEHSADSMSVRFATSVWLGHKQLSFLGIVEFTPDSFSGDDSGVWFDLTPKFKPMKWLAVGFKYRRPVGVGPLVEFLTLTSPSATIWLHWAPLDPEKFDGDLAHLDRFLIGLKFDF
jgi:hypothetical protein